MVYENMTFDEERALYGIEKAEIKKCIFDGPADGESALKETKDIVVEDCDFRLRYPFWHVNAGKIKDIRMTETCRAALWYCRDLHIENSELKGIKAVRECNNMEILNCDIQSSEFGWKSKNIDIKGAKLISEYPFFECLHMKIDGLEMKAKYSFQYVEDIEIHNAVLDTKDAFWHAKNVTVYDSVVKGEYLGWYSENLTFIRCKIIGTQPLCYCKNLTLEECTMEDCDLSFEYSEVNADIKGKIMSVKNPLSGKIQADAIGEIIMEKSVKGKSNCEIIVSK